MNTLASASSRVRQHPRVQRFKLRVGSEPVGLFLAEKQELLFVNQIRSSQITVLSARTGEWLGSIPAPTSYEPDWREKSIHGAFLEGSDNEGYLWTYSGRGNWSSP